MSMEFNLAQVQEAIGEVVGDFDAIVSSDRKLTWNDLTLRTRRLANYFLEMGLDFNQERSELQDWEVGQDRVAILLYNRPEYIETMLGAFKARLAPCNVNYRYVEEELAHLLDEMEPSAIVYERRLAENLWKALSRTSKQPVLLEVGSEEIETMLPGAVKYEEALAASSPELPRVKLSPDDLYILYTGGTTGYPKGVLWRQADIFVAALGGRNFKDGAKEWKSLAELVSHVHDGNSFKAISAAPFMHGTGQWVAFQALHSGGTIVIPSVTERFDPTSVLEAISNERVAVLAIAGESFAKPLLDALDQGSHDLSSLKVIISGGASLTNVSKQRMIERLPGVRIRDAIGSSESGSVAEVVTTGVGPIDKNEFSALDGTLVIDEKMERVLGPGHQGEGWLARRGRMPLGYHNDSVRTRETFRTVDGKRISVLGDRARINSDGNIELLGRDSTTINSGGEKIFAEEVESVLLRHPGIRDVIVVGLPSDRWGSEVVALVEPESGYLENGSDILDFCGQYLARYKLPKDVIFVDQVDRSPAGKPNYSWALRTAAAKRSN